MPRIVRKGAIKNNNSGAEIEYEMMRNIAYLTKEFGMSFKEIMELPYSVFLSYLKYMQLFQLEQTEEGRKALQESEIINHTEPDWNKVRKYTK